MKQLSAEVFYNESTLCKITHQEIDLLKNALKKNVERKRVRLCAHEHATNCLHEMFLVKSKGAYVRPHKNVGKTKSFHIIEGEADIFEFDQTGKVIDQIRMGDYRSGFVFFYRLDPNVFHSLVIRSKTLVFKETINGPFKVGDTVYAEWAPMEKTEQADVFLLKLECLTNY